MSSSLKGSSIGVGISGEHISSTLDGVGETLSLGTDIKEAHRFQEDGFFWKLDVQ